MSAEYYLQQPHQRTGQGFDVHAFDDANAEYITLFGVKIPYNRQLKGHSDADVGLHALCDAIYGICADGDIGVHFPPSKPEHKGQDSEEFLVHALALLKSYGGELIHIDLTLMGEEPKMGPHRALIIEHLCDLTGLRPQQIGFKATTTEKLGFTGRKEGLACQAIATAHFSHGFLTAKGN